MSNDNKTLADVQPGGRVRLGDALLPCPSCGEPLTINGAGDGVHKRDSDCILAQYVVVADHAPHAAAWNRRSLSAQPSPGGQGDLKSRFTEWVKANGYNPATFASGRFMGDGVQIAWEAVQALAAAQPAGEPVGEPVEHDCTNCDRKHAEVICPTCAGIAWDNGRLHEFHEVRELSTSLGEGALDHLLPDEWHEKPLLRFQGAYDEGDDSVGISPRSANVLAEDQTGTVLGDYLAARQPVGDHLAQDRKMVSQPVGEPVAFMVRWKAEGGFGLEWPKNMQYFRDRADEYEIVPLHREAPSGQAVDLGPSIPSELAPVAAALKRFNECAEDCESDGCDIGRDWFDALTTMGLLKRTQRSPAVWTMTAEGERLLALVNGKAVGNGN